MNKDKHTPKRYLVTSALPYANGPLHVGHLAGAYIPADIYVRYLRMTGVDVKFICGSDEHGAAITIKAKQEGITPKQIVDKYHAINKKSFDKIDISFDIYHRTSSPLHHETSAAYFKTLYDKGVFIEKENEQYYDEEYQQFLADRYIKGTCPKCSNPDAYGDQCENCGSDLSPFDLINPLSTLSGKAPVLKTTKHWYLPMDEYQNGIQEWIENSQEKERWKKHVLGQCRSWFMDGLQARAMTRDLDWGVKVPLPDAEGKVLYVWLDAPIGYISATKALTDDWELYWKDKDSKLVHFIGKDNIVFHCIIFPMLLNLEGTYVLPANVPANQFMNLEGDKMSTSRNHVVSVDEFLEEFPGQEDALRYMLMVNMPEQKDSDFSWQDFYERNNNELVAVLGNFVNRVMVLCHKYFKGIVPEMTDEALATVLEEASEVYTALEELPDNLDRYIHRYEFRNALNEVLNMARAGNKFLTDTEPWKLFKTDKEQTAVVLGVCLEIIAHLAVYLEPFLPFTTPKMKEMLNMNEEDVADVLKGDYSIAIGHQLNKSQILFQKWEEKVVTQQQEKLAARKADAQSQELNYEPLKAEIQYEDFAKLDIRTGTIIAAEKMKKANKLLKLTIDLGFEKRTVVSGIAEHYQAENIIGQQVLLLANLAPRKLRGVESQGMILMASDSKGQLFFTLTNNDKEQNQNGMTVS